VLLSILVSTVLCGSFVLIGEPRLGWRVATKMVVPFTAAFTLVTMLVSAALYSIPTYVRWWAISRAQSRLRRFVTLAIWVPTTVGVAWLALLSAKSQASLDDYSWYAPGILLSLLMPSLILSMIAATTSKIPTWNPAAHVASSILRDLDSMAKDLTSEDSLDSDSDFGIAKAADGPTATMPNLELTEEPAEEFLPSSSEAGRAQETGGVPFTGTLSLAAGILLVGVVASVRIASQLLANRRSQRG